MSSSASAQLQRLEIALRPGFNQRASLRSATSMGAWKSCRDSVEAAREIVGLLISESQGTTLCVHWRKSSASKQFLALLKAISEAIASEADWMSAAAISATDARIGLRLCMKIAWTHAMRALQLLYEGTKAGALWPALRDWLAENGNLQGLWGGFAWCSGAGDDAAISVVRDLVSMTCVLLSQRRLPPALLQHPRVVAEAMGQALSTVLPRGFARDHGVDLDRGSTLRMLEMKQTLLSIVALALAEPQFWPHLHLPALSLWPYLVGALRRQHGTAELSESLQGCLPSLLYMLWPSNANAAYLTRHWACAIDVVEMVAMLGDCSRPPEVGGEGQRWDRTALQLMAELIPSLEFSKSTDIASNMPLRQVWGLAVRSERAIRAAAPHWGALEAGGWGDLADRACLILSSLLAGLADDYEEPSEAWNAEGTAASLLQLLTSNAATLLKFARHSRRMDATMWRIGLLCFHGIAVNSSKLGPACPRAIQMAGPTIFFLLAPRYVAYAIHAAPSWSATRAASGSYQFSVGYWLRWLVSSCCSLIPSLQLSLLALNAQPMTTLLRLVMEEVEHSPEWNTREVTDTAMFGVSLYTESFAYRIHQLASCGCEGAAASSAQLRDLLAQPVLCLLGSPLLDQLAMLQHAPNRTRWASPYHPSFIPPMNRPEGAISSVSQGRNLSDTLHALLDAMLHLLEAAREAGGRGALGLGGGDIVGADCWWASLGSTQEDGKQALTCCLQTMWDTGERPVYTLGIKVELRLPARARTSPGLPSRMDVPTQAQAEAREGAAAVLGAIRKLAALVWPADHPASVAAAAADSGSLSGRAAAYADWEALQAEVLIPLPSSERPQPPVATSSGAAVAANAALFSSEGVQLTSAASSSVSCCWGEGLWCFNPTCTNLSGPSELATQTLACGGGCGLRYCSLECQAQGWRDGHRLSCARLRARKEGLASTQLSVGRTVGS